MSQEPGPFPAWQFKTEVGWAEVVTAVTGLAAAMSAVFNAGYFSPAHWSYVTELSFQDLLVSTAIFFPVALAFGGILRSEGALSWLLKTRVGLILMTGAGAIAVGVLGYGIFFGQVVSGYVIAIVCFLASFVLWIMLPSAAPFSIWRLVVVAFAIFAVPFFLGRGYFFASAKNFADRPATVELESKELRTGTLMRLTSGYVYMIINGAFVTLPMAQVRSISQGPDTGN